MLSVLTALTPVVNKVLDLIPDANAREQAKAALETQILTIEADIIKSQNEVNKTAAQHSSVFVAGARPAVIWVGALALLWACVLQPMLAFFAVWGGFAGTFPAIDIGPLMTIIVGVLGLGHYRSQDKKNGVATTTIKS